MPRAAAAFQISFQRISGRLEPQGMEAKDDPTWDAMSDVRHGQRLVPIPRCMSRLR